MSSEVTSVKRRLSYDQRHQQLLSTAREFIREQGSDTLTLAKLADAAGVTKPLVYQHFGTKSAVLVELYRDFKQEARQVLDSALTRAEDDLSVVARVIADSYIDCIGHESTELPGVGGALSGTSELEDLREEADAAYSARCREALEPFSRDEELPQAALHAILGAADGIARALVLERISFEDGRKALARVITGVV